MKFASSFGVLALLVLLAAGCRGSGANLDGTPTITLVEPTPIAQVSQCLNDQYPADAPQFEAVNIAEGNITSGGVRFVDISEGSGVPIDSPSAAIRLHYSGWLEDGCLFDSSYARGGESTPADFSLTNLIPGFAEGVRGMKPGGERRFAIPSELAYGPSGRGAIPPNATIHFNVELVEVLAVESPPPAAQSVCMNDLYPADAPQFEDVDPSNGAVTVGGVRLVDVETGSGFPLASLTATIRIHYSGWLEDGCLFDSSYVRRDGATVDFPLENLVPGFVEGVQGMQPGGERRMAIPPHLAYGGQGVPGVIPPDATIYFSIELEEIIN